MYLLITEGGFELTLNSTFSFLLMLLIFFATSHWLFECNSANLLYHNSKTRLEAGSFLFLFLAFTR